MLGSKIEARISSRYSSGTELQTSMKRWNARSVRPAK